MYTLIPLPRGLEARRAVGGQEALGVGHGGLPGLLSISLSLYIYIYT